jgi:hypothetical protein
MVRGTTVSLISEGQNNSEIRFRQIYLVDRCSLVHMAIGDRDSSFSLAVGGARLHVKASYALQHGVFTCNESMHAN